LVRTSIVPYCPPGWSCVCAILAGDMVRLGGMLLPGAFLLGAQTGPPCVWQDTVSFPTYREAAGAVLPFDQFELAGLGSHSVCPCSGIDNFGRGNSGLPFTFHGFRDLARPNRCAGIRKRHHPPILTSRYWRWAWWIRRVRSAHWRACAPAAARPIGPPFVCRGHVAARRGT
jgi:hypothetical protein